MATDFEIAIDGNLPQHESESGDRIRVHIDVKNITDSKQVDTLELVIDGSVVDSVSVGMLAGRSEEFTLVWTVPNVSVPESRTMVAQTTNDSSDDRNITIRPFDDTIRVRLDPNEPPEEAYVKDGGDVGSGT